MAEKEEYQVSETVHIKWKQNTQLASSYLEQKDLTEPDDGERDQTPRLREPHEPLEWPAELRHQLKYHGYKLPAV